MESVSGTAVSPTADAVSVQELLARYRKPDARKSVWQLVTTVIAFLCSWWLTYAALQVNYWLAILMAIPTGALIVRIFVLQHDCAHGSFFRNKRWNAMVGRALSPITLTPFAFWRRDHLVHHATSGNLDRRGFGDIKMLTVSEYEKLDRSGRFWYRVWRNPLFLFIIAPPLYFLVRVRLPWLVPKEWKRERSSVRWTNVALIVVYGTLAYLIGPWQLLAVHLPALIFASAAGVWLFYVQHNFDGTYWAREAEWDETEANMVGSSFLNLPAVLRWFTASIGYHHIHHLDRLIPNYNLQACHEGHEQLREVTELTLWRSFRMAKLKLWDEQQRRMVGFPAAKR